MKTINKISLAVSSILFSGALSAASIDFRHEYQHETKNNADRIKIAGDSGNHYYSVEMMFAGANGNAFKDLNRGNSEFEYGYKFKINDKVLLQPSMPVTFGTNYVAYKPQLRVQYTLDSGLVTKLRYRHEVRNFSDNKATELKSKVTANLGYKVNNFELGAEANYEKGHDNQVMFNNKDSNYDYLVVVGYKQSDWNWRPYAEFANVAVSSTSDKRQVRSRVGVTYSF